MDARPTRTQFVYDAARSRVPRTDSAGGTSTTTAFVYDAFGNLAAEYGGTPSAMGTQYVTVDAMGSNWDAGTFNAKNQVADPNCVYDNAGNVIQGPAGQTMTYDAAKAGWFHIVPIAPARNSSTTRREIACSAPTRLGARAPWRHSSTTRSGTWRRSTAGRPARREHKM